MTLDEAWLRNSSICGDTNFGRDIHILIEEIYKDFNILEKEYIERINNISLDAEDELKELYNRECKDCEYFYVDKDKDTHCSEIGWHISMYDYEDTDKEYHGRIYIDKKFNCKVWKKKI